MKYILCAAVLILTLFSACTNHKSAEPDNRQLSPQDMQEDLDILYAIIKKAHPSLNSYFPEEKMNAWHDSLENLYQTPLTERAFYNSIFDFLNEIGCAHTYVEMPGAVYDSLQTRQGFFPYPVKLIGDKLLVNYINDELPAGTEIRRINNVPVDSILRSLMPFNQVDGYHRKGQRSSAADDFSFQYYLRYGTQQFFTIDYTDTFDIQESQRIPAIALTDVNDRSNSPYYADGTSVNFDLFFRDPGDYAVMKISTFDYDDPRQQDAFEHFCENSFELLATKKTSSLIIDLRENAGGNLYNTFLLYSYFCKTSFKQYAAVTSRVPGIPYRHHLDPDFVENSLDDINTKLEEFSQKRGERFYTIPDSLISTWERDPAHYRGKLYLIANGTVSSAASYFTEMIKGSGLGTIVGEETGGGSAGGNGFSMLRYVLPNSGIKVNFPFAHMDYTFPSPKDTGHGVIPDHIVPDDGESFKKNSDRQLLFIRDSLILK